MRMDLKELHKRFTDSKGVSKDSRDTHGKLYIALRGERFDGNDFALSALENGAVAAIVAADSPVANDPKYEGLRNEGQLIVVEDPLRTLQELARFHRSRFRIPVIALTGTNGKTTTKELIRTVLATKYRVTATQGNLNNHIGVPLTLLDIHSETEIAVVEMGASAPGEIRLLASIALPTFGLITNVGTAHILGFGSFDGVKQTKGELYDYLQRTADTAFVNADNGHLVEMARMRPDLRTHFYGKQQQSARILPADWEHPFLRLDFESEGVLETNLIGNYNADNVLGALAIAAHFEVPKELAWKALASYQPANNRSQLLKTERNLLIVDAYNANPSSMAAALDSFDSIAYPNKGVILGDMRELGIVSETEHRQVLQRLQSMTLEKVWLVGSEFRAQQSAWTQTKNPDDVRFYDDVESLKQDLKQNTPNGMTWLIKGSNGIGLQKILEDL